MKVNINVVLIIAVIALVSVSVIFVPSLADNPWIIVVVTLPIVNYLVQKMWRKTREDRLLNALLKEIQYNRSIVQKELSGKTSMKDPGFFSTNWYSPPPHTTSYTKAEKDEILDVLPTRLYKDTIETYHYLTSFPKMSYERSRGTFLKHLPAERELHLAALRELSKKIRFAKY